MVNAPARPRGEQTETSPLARLRAHEWSAPERATVIALIAIVMGCLFVTMYSLALGDPVPRSIKAGMVGEPAAEDGTVQAVQTVAHNSLVFRPYPSISAALTAVDRQHVYTALDLTSSRPTLYVASAAGASVARVLDGVTTVDPAIRVVDRHPLPAADPNGLDIFYLMLVATIIGFITVFQVRANAKGLPLRHWGTFLICLAGVAGIVLSLVDGPLFHRLPLPIPETAGILALQLLTVASFTSIAAVLVGRWAILPTWLFFVVLGNSSSGGAVAPPLLPPAIAWLSQWLPSGATVSSLRNAIYFRADQHVQPIAVAAGWAAALFTTMWLVSRRRDTSPGV